MFSAGSAVIWLTSLRRRVTRADGSATDDGALMNAVTKRLPPCGSSCRRKDTGMLIVMSPISAPCFSRLEPKATEDARNVGVVNRAADGSPSCLQFGQGAIEHLEAPAGARAVF